MLINRPHQNRPCPLPRPYLALADLMTVTAAQRRICGDGILSLLEPVRELTVIRKGRLQLSLTPKSYSGRLEDERPGRTLLIRKRKARPPGSTPVNLYRQPILSLPKLRPQTANVRTPPQWRATGFSRALSVEYISTELSTTRGRSGSGVASGSSLQATAFNRSPVIARTI